MSFWQSLTGRLFKLVFGWYLALAVLVTSVQLVLEYDSINDDIAANLKSLAQSFSPSVADALWAIDRPQLVALATGIARATYVTGVQIADEYDQVTVSSGVVPPVAPPPDQGLFAAYRQEVLPLTVRTPRGEKKTIGKLAIYSDRKVAIDRVKYSFFVIIINSLIKTAGLWLIFYLVITRSLARPLATLTQTVSRIESVAEQGESATGNDRRHEDELLRLVQAMDKMQARIAAARREIAERNSDLAAALESAESANRLKSSFLANVSHELRTPLNEILGFAQILSLDDSLAWQVRQCAGEIEGSGRQLLNLINDIIDVSRIESGATEKVTVTYDLHELLSLVGKSAAIHGSTATLTIAVGVPRVVVGDVRMMRQALLNLISAALRRSGGEAVAVPVTAEVRDGAAWLQVHVSTPAADISPEQIDRVFEPFALSRQDAATAQGTGLELALAWEYARLLGGTLTAAMAPGDRLDLCLSVPIVGADRPGG